jgi:hypothetical protein
VIADSEVEMSEVVQTLKGDVEIIIGVRCPRKYSNQRKTLEKSWR